MSRWRKILVTALILLALGLLAPAGAFYWRARRALPRTGGDFRLKGLQQPARVLRDSSGAPHIYAETLEDVAFVQGFVHAQERLWQMDLLRRTARGRLSEIFGPAALEIDKENRLLGLGRVADRAAELLPGNDKKLLDAYARGVNAYIGSRDGNPLTAGLPIEYALLGFRPEPWQPGDTLAVGLNMFKLLTNRWKSELARLQVEDRVSADLAADLFVGRSQYDHPIAVPLPTKLRPRRVRTILANNCQHPLGEMLNAAAPATIAASNNWVVAGAHTESGSAMLANDMHLPHTVPAVWFMNHLTGPNLDVTGFSLPGIPFVVVGHNKNIAWGLTNLGADVQDLFVETFDPEDASRYLAPRGWQTAQRRVERIEVRGEEPVDFEVVETRHGPIVHEDGNFKFALQWTARDTEQLSFSFLAVNRASNWEEFTAAMAGYGGPAQNAVYADRNGHIGYHAIGRLPLRRTVLGYLPVPGDSAEFDWNGYVPFEMMPHNFDPPEGVLATGNNRVVPSGYPVYITDRWMNPSRIHRIYQVLTEALESNQKLTPQDMLRLQGDIVSLPNLWVARHILDAASTTDDHPALRAQALELLRGWDGQMSAESTAPLIADLTRRQLLQELLEPKLGNDWRTYNWWMAPVFLENVLRNRPPRWLPSGQPDYDAFLLEAFDRALAALLDQSRTPALDKLRWGDQMKVRMSHLVGGRLPLLRRWFSVTGKPQSGGRYTVKQTGRGFGPSERLVVDFSGLDATLMNITMGQSGHFLSPHYKDQFPAWFEVRGLMSPFTPAAVERGAQHTLQLLPQ